MIKAFRGMLADGAEERIKLKTIEGKVGYRMIKLELLPYDPAGQDSESIVKVYDAAQGGGDPNIDFTDSNLLGAAFYRTGAHHGSGGGSSDPVVILERKIFNQDIFINHKDESAAPNAMNYYLELEVIPLSDGAAEFTTIQSLRSSGF